MSNNNSNEPQRETRTIRIDNHAEELMLDRSSLVRMILHQHVHPLETPHEGDA